MSAEEANGEGSSVIGAMAVGGELDDGSVMAAGGGHKCASSARSLKKLLKSKRDRQKLQYEFFLAALQKA